MGHARTIHASPDPRALAHILNEVWEYGFDPGNNIVDVYVSYLRKMINFDDAAPLILTVCGAGYRRVAH